MKAIQQTLPGFDKTHSEWIAGCRDIIRAAEHITIIKEKEPNMYNIDNNNTGWVTIYREEGFGLIELWSERMTNVWDSPTALDDIDRTIKELCLEEMFNTAWLVETQFGTRARIIHHITVDREYAGMDEWVTLNYKEVSNPDELPAALLG